MKQNRRTFLKLAGFGAFSIPGIVGSVMKDPKITHIVSVSFDDGFEKSFVKTAEIYEKYRLSACFNVIATAHTESFKAPDDYILSQVVGDFQLWNELQDRGHEIMPHGYKHANLAHIPLDEAKTLIKKSLDYFGAHLKAFKPKRSIFNFPFNSSTVELEHWLNDKVLAYRTAGNVINTLPYTGQKKLTCISAGPENIDAYFEDQLNIFLSEPQGWFIFNAHGLDGEGWGPLSAIYLDEVLDRLLELPHVKIQPVGRTLLSI
jgi:peptidoglycan/xylan/chitin deacetylase (PgdA/CDA1 family)